MDLPTQIGAMVGTSLVIYLATTPRGVENDLQDYYLKDDRPRLKGARKYSSYHRKKLYRTLSKVSDVSSISDNASVSSSASSSASNSISSNYSR